MIGGGTYGQSILQILFFGRPSIDLMRDSRFVLVVRFRLASVVLSREIGRLKDEADMSEAAMELQSPAALTPAGSLIGCDPAMGNVLQFVDRVARIDATVLICGETGTGKELIARSIWQNSRRSNCPFEVINCAAVPESLQESAFFGHAKGAFTGAEKDRRGWFEAVDGGTLFLDEVHHMRPALQGMLLRILQSGEFTAVGSTETCYCDVRVIAATNVDLQALVADGGFREDLYYRLNIIPIEVPPLRQRPDDIVLLARHFIDRYAERFGIDRPAVSDAALERLQTLEFRGNVRELESVVQYALVLADGGCIKPEHLPASCRRSPTVAAATCRQQPYELSFQDGKARVIADFERAYLASVLDRCGGVVAQAARLAELSERNFHAKLRHYRIDYRHYRERRRIGA